MRNPDLNVPPVLEPRLVTNVAVAVRVDLHESSSDVPAKANSPAAMRMTATRASWSPIQLGIRMSSIFPSISRRPSERPVAVPGLAQLPEHVRDHVVPEQGAVQVTPVL